MNKRAEMNVICRNVCNFVPKFVIEYSMKRLFRPFWVLVVCCWTLMISSCLSSSDDTTSAYNDMAIKTFSLGTLNRYLHKTTSAGKDSVYKVTYAGSVYKMHIDQLMRKIYNTDSLLTNTDVKHVICTITTVNGGTVLIKSMTSDSLRYFSSGSDSIDFSQPRVFRIMAADGSGYRDYTVTLNARQQEKDVFKWEVADKENFPEASDDDIRQEAEAAGLTYIGSNSYEAYAMTSDRILVESENQGQSWVADILDTNEAYLPKNELAYVSWFLDYKTDYALLVGQRHISDKAMTIWRKLVDDDGNGQWVYMPLADENPYYLPIMAWVKLVVFNNQVLAFGSNRKVYVSRDQGITWKPSSNYYFPDGFGGTSCKVTVDDEDGLWFTDPESGKTWRGYLTK